MRASAATEAGHDAAAFHHHDRVAEVPKLYSVETTTEHVIMSLDSRLFLYPGFQESFEARS